MRLNERNKSNVYYALYQGSETTMEDGLYTGENPVVYGNVTKERMVVGTNSGISALEQFGIADPFTVTIVTDNTACPIDTSSILWLFMGEIKDFSEEETYEDGSMAIKDGAICKYNAALDEWEAVPHTHVVTRVSKSFNYIKYLVKEVEVTISGK